MRTLEARKQSAPPGSYTNRLYNDNKLLHAKIMEEASELCEASTKEEIAWEAADVLYFALVKCAKAGKERFAIIQFARWISEWAYSFLIWHILHFEHTLKHSGASEYH